MIRATQDERTASTATRARLLLIDDDRLILATVCQGLQHAGYEVSIAASAGEAIEALGAAAFDLAIVDVRMPGTDGLELARWLRQSVGVPFLFLSAYGDLEIVRTAADLGALGYLLKPLDIPHMIPPIEAALARGREIAHLRDAKLRLTTALSVEQKTRIAVDLLMERERLDRNAGLELLRARARAQGRDVADVAQDILEAGERSSQARPGREDTPV